MNPVPDDILEWAERFSAAVRARDLDGARRLFAPTVRAFGTALREADSLEDLARGQWSAVWTRTRDFRFEPGSLRCARSGDGDTAFVHGLWSSHRVADQGRREGRATLVLRRSGPGGAWLAVHSHFSMTPADGGLLG